MAGMIEIGIWKEYQRLENPERVQQCLEKDISEDQRLHRLAFTFENVVVSGPKEAASKPYLYRAVIRYKARPDRSTSQELDEPFLRAGVHRIYMPMGWSLEAETMLILKASPPSPTGTASHCAPPTSDEPLAQEQDAEPASDASPTCPVINSWVKGHVPRLGDPIPPDRRGSTDPGQNAGSESTGKSGPDVREERKVRNKKRARGVPKLGFQRPIRSPRRIRPKARLQRPNAPPG